MKPIKNIESVDKNNVILPETIEDKLKEAEKDYEEGRTHTEEEVWGMFSKKYGFELQNTLYGFDIYIYTPNELKINDCIGCSKCFFEGKCFILDDMSIVKNKLIDSDLIIFASPVYVHQITGCFKTFIDRIGYWTHTLKLTGKIGVSVALSDNNGNEFVIEYISKVM